MLWKKFITIFSMNIFLFMNVLLRKYCNIRIWFHTSQIWQFTYQCFQSVESVFYLFIASWNAQYSQKIIISCWGGKKAAQKAALWKQCMDTKLLSFAKHSKAALLPPVWALSLVMLPKDRFSSPLNHLIGRGAKKVLFGKLQLLGVRKPLDSALSPVSWPHERHQPMNRWA